MSDTFQCPNCKHTYDLVPARGGASAGWGVPYQESTMNRMNFGGGKSQPVKQQVRSIPVSSAAPSMESNFKTPISISLATGIFVVGLSILFEAQLLHALRNGGISAFALWVILVFQDRARGVIKEVLTMDNDDVPQEKPKPQKGFGFTIMEKKNGNSWIGKFQSPIDPPVLGQFARAFLAGRPMGERNWTGPGQPFSVNEYVEFRNELMERGLVRWKNNAAHRQGFELTLRGQRAFKELSAIPATTPPELLQ